MEDDHFEISSELHAQPETVWRDATDMRRVNEELGPWIRMTFPAGAADLLASEVPVGRRLFRSWILLLGVLPIDRYDVTFAELDPGRRFVERSPTLTQRLWQHERRVEPHGSGTRVTDHVTFGPRAAVLRPALRWFVRSLFTHRHRRLRARFGAREP